MVLGADVAYVIHLDRHKLRKKIMDDLSKGIQLPLNYIQAVDNKDYLFDIDERVRQSSHLIMIRPTWECFKVLLDQQHYDCDEEETMKRMKRSTIESEEQDTSNLYL